MKRKKEELYQYDEKAKRIPKKEVHVMMNKNKRLMKEGEVHIVTLNQAKNLPIKEKDHTMMSQFAREKIAQRILRK